MSIWPKDISTTSAPAAIGPYSQAIMHNGLVYCSGQIALDAETGELIEGDVSAQAHKCLQNLKAVLLAANTDLDQALKVTVFLKDLEDFAYLCNAESEVDSAITPLHSPGVVRLLT